jgi:pimeloyl-ACP methyl ester carboxylesterase
MDRHAESQHEWEGGHVSPVHDVVVAGTHVDVQELGAGQPVVVVQTALGIDELEPLSRALSTGSHVWHVHRPGYGTSGPARSPGSIRAEIDFVMAVLGHLDLGPAHLVGASYSAAVVLSLASLHPEAARSVALVEPPPYGTTRAEDFRVATSGLLDIYARAGASAALEQIMILIDGPDWRAHAERDLPGSVAAMERDASTFFVSDLPALLGWSFDDAQAAAVACPVLLLGGSASLDWFGEMLDRLESVIATTTRVTVAGAGHSAALTHPAEVAEAMLDHVLAVSSATRADGGAGDRS